MPNPEKCAAEEGYGFEVVERIAARRCRRCTTLRYLQTKRDKLGHDIVLAETQTA